MLKPLRYQGGCLQIVKSNLFNAGTQRFFYPSISISCVQHWPDVPTHGSFLCKCCFSRFVILVAAIGQHSVNYLLWLQLRKDWNPFMLLFLSPVYHAGLIYKHMVLSCVLSNSQFTGGKNKQFCQNVYIFTVNALHWENYLLLPPQYSQCVLAAATC